MNRNPQPPANVHRNNRRNYFERQVGPFQPVVLRRLQSGQSQIVIMLAFRDTIQELPFQAEAMA